MSKSEIKFGTSLEEDQVDEMDFGSIGKTLSKYGKGVPADEPKKVKRSAVNTDYTMTGHKEKKTSTGRVYSKVLPDDEDSGKAAKSTVAAEPAVKRGRGRPAGALNKNGSGVTGKGWSDEAKASMKAKLAARKAAKLAGTNESEELEEAKTYKAMLNSLEVRPTRGTDKDLLGKAPTFTHGQNGVNLSTDDGYKAASDAAHAQGEEMFRGRYTIRHVDHHGQSIPGGSVDKARKAMNESVGLDEEDWADITEGQSLNSIVEFMLDEEYQSLDELSKKTLGSYIKKAAGSSTVNATAAMHNNNHEKEARADAEYYRKAGEPENAKRREGYADTMHKASYDATETSTKRLKGVAKATDRLTKESKEANESVDSKIARYAAKLSGNLIKE
jgi:hypothetical protein